MFSAILLRTITTGKRRRQKLEFQLKMIDEFNMIYQKYIDKHVTYLLEPILISAHALNVSCGPQPRHVSPVEFSPQLFAVLYVHFNQNLKVHWN